MEEYTLRGWVLPAPLSESNVGGSDTVRCIRFRPQIQVLRPMYPRPKHMNIGCRLPRYEISTLRKGPRALTTSDLSIDAGE